MHMAVDSTESGIDYESNQGLWHPLAQMVSNIIKVSNWTTRKVDFKVNVSTEWPRRVSF